MSPHRRQVVRQRRRAPAQPHLESPHLTNPARQALDGWIAGLTMREAAVYLRYHDERCSASCRCADIARQFLRRHHVPLRRRGRALLVQRAEIDRVLDDERFAQVGREA